MSTPDEASEDLRLLTDAARESGKIALRYWRRHPRAWDKENNAGPVCEADLAVDSYLREMLQAARPDYGWLSEESEDDGTRLATKRCFICDPIDGTRAFIAGQEGFSHALAVVEDDRVIAGVVYLPVSNTLYAATEGGPATRNGEVIAPHDVALAGARVLTARTWFDPSYWRNQEVPEIRQVFRSSLAWRFCLVSEGQFDGVMSLRGAWEWDVAAGALIAERAGCTVTDMRGQRMRFNQPKPMTDGLLAAPSGLHAALLARLAP